MNYIKNHWMGNFSLKRSFWINFMFVNFLYGFVSALLLLYMMQNRQLDSIERFLWNYYLIFLVISFWQTVGIHRASVHYMQSSAKNRIWAVIARTVTLFFVVSTILSLVSLATMSPKTAELLTAQLNEIMVSTQK